MRYYGKRFRFSEEKKRVALRDHIVLLGQKEKIEQLLKEIDENIKSGNKDKKNKIIVKKTGEQNIKKEQKNKRKKR